MDTTQLVSLSRELADYQSMDALANNLANVSTPGFKREAPKFQEFLDPMQPAAFGMFLVHYPIVLWLQYWLFDFDVPAIAKALIAFVLTVILSWGATEVLRKIPGAQHVL